MYNHFTVYKQITDVKLLVLHSNTWNHLTVCKQITDLKLLVLDINTWNHLIVCKQMSSDWFKNVIDNLFANKIYLIYV